MLPSEYISLKGIERTLVGMSRRARNRVLRSFSLAESSRAWPPCAGLSTENARRLAAREMLSHYVIRSRNLFDRTPELRERFGSCDSPEYLSYVDSEALLYIRELQEVAPPFPPWREMVTVCGETDLRKFLSCGRDCFNLVRPYLKSGDNKKVLDFGVGCGRTMRFFFREHSDFQCYGCDVDSRSIAYLKESVPFIRSAVSRNCPPLPYDAGIFDYIYSISVFTHLNEAAIREWLREIARVLKRGALFMPTFHGKVAYQRVVRDPAHRHLIGINDDEFYLRSPDFEQTGFMWISQPVGSNEIDSEQYGISFTDEARLRKYVDSLFEVLEYRAGAIGGWQDLAVLRRL